MYLKALTLHGFKSFADPTTLRFEPGVTAVVGPNGCGKSNIADAIRWVLGEQSARALRGGKMQDVIFEGADTRKPAQLCEVALLLTDCERQLGSDFHEIEIMRRVHRDGAGEYFFNGQACRLKDVQKLFMDTGVGRTSYSIMAQGQIDQILSSKPEERRAVFEEAAGITKYKSQRREAMNKLALTDQNLARVSDIVGEVSRQIGSLRRQAAKAVRYKRLSHRLRHLSLAASAHQHAELMAAADGLDRRVGQLRAAAAERKARLDERQSALEGRKAERSRLNQRVQEAQQAVFDVRSQKEQAENAGRLAQVRRSGLEDRLASSRDNLTEIGMQLREVSAQVDTGVQDKQMQLGLLGSSDAVFQQRSRELAIVDGRSSKLEQDLQQARFELLQQESTVARLRTDCSGYEVEQKTSLNRRDAMTADLERARGEAAAAAAAAAGIAAKVREAAGQRDQATAAASDAQGRLGELTRDFREAQRLLQEIDRQLAQRTARLRVLQQLQERWEGFGEGAKAVLQGRLEAALNGTRAAPIMQGLDVKSDCARAVEALLGSAVEAIAVADVATAKRILAQLESEQIGSAILRLGGVGPGSGPIAPVPGIAAPGQPGSTSPATAGLVPATEALKGIEEGHPAVALLASSYIAEDLGAFLDFWQANPGFEFLAVATRKGELVDRRGIVAGGHANPKKHAQSLVQREIDLRETARALAAEQARHDAQKAKADGISGALAGAEQELEARREAVLAATQAAAAVQAEHRTAERAGGDAANRVRRMEEERASLEQACAEAQTRWARAQEGLAEAEAKAAALRERIQKLDTEIAEVRADRDVKRESLAQARLELAERRQKVEVLDRGLGEMERRRQQLSELLVQRQHEIETWTEQSAELERESAAQAERAQRLADTLGVSQGQVERIRSELAGLEREIDGLEAEQAKLREEAEAAHEELAAHEVKLAETRQRSAFLAEEAQREFQADLATLDWKLALWRADDEPEQMQVLDLDEETEGEPLPPPPALPGAEPAAAADEAAKPHKPRPRKPKAPRGEPTEKDLADLEPVDWALVRTEVDALRQRLGTMGAVNLVAIEEYAELKQRHDFLRGQSDDLTRARAELLQAIDEINRTSQEQFAVTFEQIRKNFAYTFQTLFGGGRAELELIQAEDILESGIEIVAQPPGTKLKSITLLSGGQKTLTAVALLFALYMVKPSPFCLLDELDAPLDESNIERFTKLLEKFVKESQFIIITHNKRTVAAAHAIYGVTMEERGVSKTVSMRFNHERGEAEAHRPTLADSVRGAQPPPSEPVPASSAALAGS